jgi:hypothetical protein
LKISTFCGVIFCPEKNAFECKVKKNHSHFAQAIPAAQYFEKRFLVVKLIKNCVGLITSTFHQTKSLNLNEITPFFMFY